MHYEEAKRIADSMIESITANVRDEGPDDENQSVAAQLTETIDPHLDMTTDAVLDSILTAYGEVDLSEPAPDLKQGRFRVRKQLAYNATTIEITRRLRNAGVL